MKIAALEPYAALSHVAFLEDLKSHSGHEIVLRTLPARYWKWRMRTASMHFAKQLAQDEPYDILLLSDYVNGAELKALLPPHQQGAAMVVYFHENQLSYPLQEGERRDVHHGLTHFHSILASTRSVFNSNYHLESFFRELEALVQRIPDMNLRPEVERARQLSQVLPIGTELDCNPPRVEPLRRPPVLLWSHRWEYDKDPLRFLEAAVGLMEHGVDFRIRLLGQRFQEEPEGLEALRRKLEPRILQVGFVGDREAYLEALRTSDIVVSTARHEFFGIGTLEALRSGCLPLLPNDLAYPELLASFEGSERFLYEPASDLSVALKASIEAVVHGRWAWERETLVRETDRFHWKNLAPLYDRLFEDVHHRR